ncbi:hypothetical protein [Amycolatopsis sp. cmx-4-68]|uniref:hypothetical protein n=1 Tax=Amycolatopsis sp. cmx-4-68 TaxID=2790938 RepID=UPI00397919E4
MSMPVLEPYGLDGGAGAPVTTEAGAISPFAPVTLPGGTGPVVAAPPPGQVLHSPFAEAATAVGDHDLGAEAAGALLAELDDTRFAEALELLEDDVAGRHLQSVGSWSHESAAPVLATADTTEWMAGLAEEADRMLGALEAHFGDRPADSVQPGEIDAVAGTGEAAGFTDPLTAQQLFLGGLLDKAKKLARGVGKLAKKGLAFAGRLALGPLFGILRKLVRPLLRKVLDSAIGRLPASLRPLAGQLAAKLRGSGEPAAEENLAEEFDRDVATMVTAPNEAAPEQAGLSEAGHEPPGPGHDLDDARARLARELASADPGVPPTEQLEQFIPVVMAALPLIRTGIGLIGRDKVVDGIAGPLSQLISGMVGADAAKLLSRHIAGAGLGLLGLEAEGDGSLGGEALVAAAEDTVRQVMTLPPESLGHELLLETEVQDAFADAAARHLPAAVLRPELVERELDTEHGVWVMMPRATKPCFRYKKYGRVIPVRLTRPVARAVVLSGGETLERRLLESGVQAWPVDGEVELYELLPGGLPGHLAAFEAAGIADAHEFEELTPTAATLLAGHPRFAGTGRPGGFGGHRRAGGRYFRFRRHGRPLHRGFRQRFAVGFDLTAPQPVLRVNLLVGERDAHELAAQLQRRQLVQVVSTVRRLLDDAALQAMTARLDRLLTKHGVTAPAGVGRQLAQRLADGMLRTVSQQLPASAQTLAQAAQDPAPGATLTFTFSFADRAAVAAGTPAGDPAVTIRPGLHRD